MRKWLRLEDLLIFLKAVDPLLLFGSDEEGDNQLNEGTYNVGVKLSKYSYMNSLRQLHDNNIPYYE